MDRLDKKTREMLVDVLKEIRYKKSTVDLVLGDEENGWNEYPLEKGVAYTKCIDNKEGEFGAAYTVISTGISYKHHHPKPIKEGILLLYGRATLKYIKDGEDCEHLKMEPMSFVVVPANQEHIFVTYENTGVITVTMPPDPNFPKK